MILSTLSLKLMKLAALSIPVIALTLLLPGCTTVVNPEPEPTTNTTSTYTQKSATGSPTTSSTETKTTRTY